jgi:hypothetical protein
MLQASMVTTFHRREAMQFADEGERACLSILSVASLIVLIVDESGIHRRMHYDALHSVNTSGILRVRLEDLAQHSVAAASSLA